MTVAELIEHLKEYPPDMEVRVPGDPWQVHFDVDEPATRIERTRRKGVAHEYVLIDFGEGDE